MLSLYPLKHWSNLCWQHVWASLAPRPEFLITPAQLKKSWTQRPAKLIWMIEMILSMELVQEPKAWLSKIEQKVCMLTKICSSYSKSLELTQGFHTRTGSGTRSRVGHLQWQLWTLETAPYSITAYIHNFVLDFLTD